MGKALIVVDVQNDFCPGGALGVSGGDTIVQPINAAMRHVEAVILTQDWHPITHTSFANNNRGAEPFSTVRRDYGAQVLWPVHCVQGSEGARFHKDLDVNSADMIIRKGFRPAIDSYSAFYENDRKTVTGLEGYLRSRGLHELTLVGLATDFCVAWSALDAARQGFDVTVDLALCRGINVEGSMGQALSAMSEAGIRMIGK